MKTAYRYGAIVFCFCSPLFAGQKSPVKPTPTAPRTTAIESVPQIAVPPVAVVPEPEPSARIIQYGRNDVVKLKASLRFTSLVVLPKEERILDFTCGDKEFWIINGTQNLAFIKPAKAGAKTNLNLITASGNIFSFVLSEISDVPTEKPDLKVFIVPRDESMFAAANAPPRFVSADTLDDYRAQISQAKDETRRVKESEQAAIDDGINKFLSNVRFPYRFEAGKKPFGVRAMYNDEKFTYIQARPEEIPMLYEIKDGMPTLVSFQYKDGVYVVDKILDRGYLAIGNKRLNFERED